MALSDTADDLKLFRSKVSSQNSRFWWWWLVEEGGEVYGRRAHYTLDTFLVISAIPLS